MPTLHSITPILPSPASAEETLIEKPEVARRLDKSIRTVDAWMRKGYLPHIKIGKAVLFRWSTVLEHLESRFRVG